MTSFSIVHFTIIEAANMFALISSLGAKHPDPFVGSCWSVFSMTWQLFGVPSSIASKRYQKSLKAPARQTLKTGPV